MFGWQINKVPDMGEYFIALTTESDPQIMQPKNPGTINGRMFKKDSTTSKQPLMAIGVDSVDEHIKKIEASGGKTVMQKTAIGQFGLYARISDTEGNEIGICEALKQ